MNDNDFSNRLHNDQMFQQQVLSEVDENSTYYLDKWKNANSPFQFAGWNWAAFFVTPFWLSYRHMYGAVLIYFCLLLIIGAVSVLFPLIIYYTPMTEAGEFWWRAGSTFFLSFFFGLKGNALYAKFIVRHLARKNGLTQPNVPLFHRSGQSWLSAFIAPLFLYVFLMLPLFWLDDYVKTSTLPYGTYVFLEEEGAPQSITDALYGGSPIFNKYTSSLQLLYFSKEPIGNHSFQFVLHYRDSEHGEWEEVRQQTYTFFSSNRIEVKILDTEDPLTEVGDYRVDVMIDNELKDTITFQLKL